MFASSCFYIYTAAQLLLKHFTHMVQTASEHSLKELNPADGAGLLLHSACNCMWRKSVLITRPPAKNITINLLSRHPALHLDDARKYMRGHYPLMKYTVYCHAHAHCCCRGCMGWLQNTTNPGMNNTNMTTSKDLPFHFVLPQYPSQLLPTHWLDA